MKESIPALRAAFLTAACFLLVAGCGSEKKDKPEKVGEELLLYCGAGIRPPVVEAIKSFEAETGTKVIVDYAGGEVLLSRMTLMKKGDIYMPGDRHYVEQAAEKGYILSSRKICYFVPAIMVAKGNPKNVRGLSDLVRTDVRVGVGSPQACAIGRKTMKIFDKNGIDVSSVNIRFRSLTVNELGIQIKSGSLDAVIIWNAVAAYYSDCADVVAIPPDKNIISTVDAGVLKFTRNRAMAERFVDFLASDRGREIFRKHHYCVERPE